MTNRYSRMVLLIASRAGSSLACFLLFFELPQAGVIKPTLVLRQPA